MGTFQVQTTVLPKKELVASTGPLLTLPRLRNVQPDDKKSVRESV